MSYFPTKQHLGVASSSGRTPALGAGGWGFESLVALTFLVLFARIWSCLSLGLPGGVVLGEFDVGL